MNDPLPDPNDPLPPADAPAVAPVLAPTTSAASASAAAVAAPAPDAAPARVPAGTGAPSPAAATAAAPSAAAQRDPLHGMTLEAIVVALVERYGWAGLGDRVPLRCFTHEPSVASSLKLLRRTPWAREKVEGLYLYALREDARRRRAAGPKPPAPR